MTKPPQRPLGSVGVTRRTAIAFMTVAARQAMGASSPLSASVSDPSITFAWKFAEGATINTASNSSFTLATDVPIGSTVSASPDLLPGQTLNLSGSTLSIFGDSTVPTVNGDVPGSAKDAISARDVTIEVLGSPLAVCNHIRNGSKINTYGSGLGDYRTISYALRENSRDGDIFEISPGAVAADKTGWNVNGYFLEACVLLVYQSVTVRGMAGRGRWRLFPAGEPITQGFSGIVIPGAFDYATYGQDHDPTTQGRRKTVVISDFELEGWGIGFEDYGLRVRNPSSTASTSWDQYVKSVTLRNFKIGMPPNYGCGDGIKGSVETWNIEDGHVYDCGGAFDKEPGYSHNLYVGGRYLNMRGVRSARSRTTTEWGRMDGHLCKVRASQSLIEGCVFEAYGMADNTDLVQYGNGGAHTLTGCLLIQGRTPSTNNGSVVYENEGGTDQQWDYGQSGHTLAIRRNVFISHANVTDSTSPVMVMFRDPIANNHVPITSLAIQDNIGMSANVTPDKWIARPQLYPLTGFAPLPGYDWAALGNTVMTHSYTEDDFSDKALKLYTRTAGPIAATGAVQATLQFIWPHGSIARSDSHRGLA